MDEQQYLDADFDPATLTVPRLRSILVAHNVNYPSSAKKPQLIELFNEHVMPQAPKIRAANARVKRTSRGIEDVGSQSTQADEEEEEQKPEPPRTGRAGRRTTRARTEEAEDVQPTSRSARHSTAPPEGTPVRRASAKHVRQVETVEEEPEPKRPASRKSRSSAATPAVKQEDKDESPFSNENVFQTGSSPPAPDNRRRTTLGTRTSETDRRRSRDSREVRRRTEDYRPIKPQIDGVTVPSRKTFEMPVSRVTKQEEPEDETEAGEEFVPEEEQALVQAQQSGGLVPTRRKTKAPPAGAKKLAPIMILLAALGGIGQQWRNEKLEVGYCGVGNPSTEVAGVHIPDWADILRPQCQVCPQHAYCDERLQTECEPGFVLTQHPLSLGGIVPIAPSCEPDSQRAKRVQQVKERAVEQLREQNAKYECGEASSPQVAESTLRETIAAQKSKSMTDDEFNGLWDIAMPEIQKTNEVQSGSDGTGFTLRSTSLARVPLSCAIRRSISATLKQYVPHLIAILIISSGGLYGKHAITSGRETEGRAKQLASEALEQLRLQASYHAQDSSVWGEGYISVAQLRDDVLRDEFSASRRKALWEKVQRKVEGNANVRPMVREGRSGDVGRVWEWIGALGMIESPNGPSSGDRRRSGVRKSVGFVGERLIEDTAGNDSTEMTERSNGHVSKWEEGRQYY